MHTLNGSGLAVGRALVAVLENYQEERTNIGKQGGDEIRHSIFEILSDHQPWKRSHIVQEVNRRINREVYPYSVGRYLGRFVKKKLISQPKKSYYQLNPMQ